MFYDAFRLHQVTNVLIENIVLTALFIFLTEKSPVTHKLPYLVPIYSVLALVSTLPVGHITVWESSIKHLQHYCLTACTFKLHVI